MPPPSAIGGELPGQRRGDGTASEVAWALSIVAPCYDEESCLVEFCRRTAVSARAAVGSSYEIILVDDGSRDGTWALIEALSTNDPRIIGVKLLRNHGHQLAASAGVALAKGERVLLIDADLQDPPELLPQMMAALDQGAHVAYGRREERLGESRFKRLTASAFYRVLERLTSVPIPRDTGDFRLMTRRVVDILNAMPERHRFIRGMVSWIGGRQVAIPYARDPRFAGQSKYPIVKMLRLAFDAITGFSTVPLRFATWLGLLISTVAFLFIAYILIRWASGDVVPGWASTAVSSSLFAGTQLLVLGIIGEYLGRLVEDAKRRPLFMIESITDTR